MSRLTAVYRFRAGASEAAARAQAIAVEQSVEMPLSAITDASVLANIAGRVASIRAIGPNLHEAQIELASETVCCAGGRTDPGQLLNMLFGNSSLHDDVTLHDIELPPHLLAGVHGPNLGLALRPPHAAGRALTCGALKPQGLPPAQLADLARRMAAGGLDFIKDDHGLANQAFSPFAARVPAIAAALRAEGAATRYVPSLSSNAEEARAQLRLARSEGVRAVMAATMLLGPANFAGLARDNKDIAFFAHPSFAGLPRIAPPLLYGKLFRLLGADAVIFPNHGGRFGYTAECCAAIARTARAPFGKLRASLPVPAGGMVPERVPEMLDFYGCDTILLIGGALLAAGARLTEAVAAFTRLVAERREKEDVLF